MRRFRLLKPSEIECRVSRSNSDYVFLLLYKTARTDYSLFDETFGEMNWQCRYEMINNVMYCGIGVYCEERKEWVWKWNAGTESNTEAEKGQASDALKRAGFAWGCGTELYSAPFICIDIGNVESKNGKISDNFAVKNIGYDETGNITLLEITNKKRKVVFSFGTGKRIEEQEAEPTKELPKYLCSNCGCEITGAKRKDGVITAEEVAERTKKKYGKVLCPQCAKVANDAGHEG